jgi:hypothetical protein
MHRTTYVSHHSFNTMMNNDFVTLNPEKIVNSDVKCRSLWCTRMRSNHWSTLLCVRWSHVALWEHLLQEGIQILCRFNEVDYPKARLWVLQWSLLKLYFVQGEMKNSQGTKRIYHVIKSGVSRKRGSELSNSVLTLVWLQNDSMEG